MIVLGSPSSDILTMAHKRRVPIELIVMGGSAGSFSVTNRLLATLPESFPTPIVIVLHRLKEKREGFREALQIRSGIQIVEPDDKTPIEKGKVYIAPANYHLLIESRSYLSLATTELVQYSRPSIDVLFDSAADVFGSHCLGILLSGANRDGAFGLKRIQSKGGATVVQAPHDAPMPTMPEAAMKMITPDLVLTEEELQRLFAMLHATGLDSTQQ